MALFIAKVKPDNREVKVYAESKIVAASDLKGKGYVATEIRPATKEDMKKK